MSDVRSPVSCGVDKPTSPPAPTPSPAERVNTSWYVNVTFPCSSCVSAAGPPCPGNPSFAEFIGGLTPDLRPLFHFPPVGDGFYTASSLRAMEARYPGWDSSGEYEAAAALPRL